MDTDQLVAIVDQHQRRYNSASAGGNCSDIRGTEMNYSGGKSDVSAANWKQNFTKKDDVSEIRVTEKVKVTDRHHQSVAYALHLASTIILGLLVLEVSNIWPTSHYSI